MAHLGHVELLTPKPCESVSFFTAVMGMDEVARTERSVYLRGFGDYERYCLKVTESPRPGLGHVALRASSAQALHDRVAALEASGLGLGWADGDVGHGPAYRFTDPDGRPFELYYETERYEPPESLKPPMLNQFQRRSTRGVGIRRLEHANFLSPDVATCRAFLETFLGYRAAEVIELEDGSEYGAWLTVTIQGHELIYIKERLPARGRLHHVAFWVDTREEVLRAADIFQDSGVFIEAGPAKHTPIHSFYLYAYEPGGNRVEVTSGGYLVFDPDPAATVRWPVARYRSSRAWGREFPPSFDTYATPPLEVPTAASATPPRHERGEP